MPIGIMGIVLVAAAALGAGALISTYILPPEEHNVYVETGAGDIKTGGGSPMAGFMDMLPWIVGGIILLVVVYWYFIKRKK